MAAKKKIVKFTFDGMDFECVEDKVRSFRLQKAIAMVANPNVAPEQVVAYYDALDEMFGGRTDEYAEMVGDDMARMGALYSAAVEAVGAKN